MSRDNNKPRLGNHVYFWVNGKMVMKIIPENMTPEEVIEEFKRNNSLDMN